jgi:hypothetical protein
MHGRVERDLLERGLVNEADLAPVGVPRQETVTVVGRVGGS